MKILYYSCHEILEFEEISIFKSLGHSVCSLGRTRDGQQTALYRPSRSLNQEEERFYIDYERCGGVYDAPADSDDFIPQGFADQFDVVIVMHQFHIIQQNWQKFSKCTVVWRTIGQDIDNHERYLAPFRESGLKIVRYSPAELSAPNSLGFDAIIRFGKDPLRYDHWVGAERHLLSFVNSIESRFPQEAKDFRNISSKVSCSLGGASNDAFAEWIGFKDYENQTLAYRQCGAYLYITALDIPYTLNFIEAWMTGVPMIVYAPRERLGYYEVDKLVEDGVTGRVCRCVDEVVEVAKELFACRHTAASLGAAGRAEAIRHFGVDAISRQWRLFLEGIAAR